MYVNRNHPKFKVTQEILCMIPVSPTGVSVQNIADDLGLSRDDISARISDLKRRFPCIHYPERGKIAADPQNASIIGMREEAVRYWNLVYGGDTSCPTETTSHHHSS